MSASASRPHRRAESGVAAGHRYARDVLTGRRKANLFERAAVRRHARDLTTAREPGALYYFDSEAAERAIRFIELLPHTKGKWALGEKGRPGTNLIVLEPWQCFIVMCIFGWLNRRTGKRRFLRVYLEIPRKNGKSLLASAIGLYMFLCDHEYGAEVYSGATSEKQAWEVFRPARLICLRTPKLVKRFGLAVHAKSLSVVKQGSIFEPVVGKPGDGASPHCAIVDEYHEHKDDALYDTMETGMGAREQPLMLVITTAGDNIEGPCYAMRSEAVKVLQGALEDDQLFCLIFTLDKDDDWTTDEAIFKANPNAGISVGLDYLRGQVKKAVSSPRKRGVTKTKHFNMWVSARDAYFPLEEWLALGDPSLTLDKVAHLDCIAALDVAYKTDICSLVKLFRDGPMYYVLSDHWLPETRIEDPTEKHYKEWHEIGALRQADGDVNDLTDVEDHLVQFSNQVYMRELAMDPYKVRHFGQAMQDDHDMSVVFYNTSIKTMSEPMKEVHDMILSGRFVHDGNPAMNWMMSNVVTKPNRNDDVFPMKQNLENKIDGPVALIMAMGRMLEDEDNTSLYEKRGLRFA